MARILIVAEHAEGRLNLSTAKCLSCAAAIAATSNGAAIDVVVLGAETAGVASAAAALAGVERVLTLERGENREPIAAIWAPQIAALASGYSHLLGPSTTFGKDLMPRIAALLGVGQVSELMSVEASLRFRRPIYASNVIVTVEAPADRILVATVRVASFAAAGAGGSARIEAVKQDLKLPGHTRFVARSAPTLDRPDLQTATRVVSGGRALASADNFQLLYRLAEALGAAVGASRAAVDAGYVPNELQVGQTGKIIAPELYLALGISGAIQHLTGIKDARTIVAINKDSEAPIFEVADIGLVGDLFQIVPELERLIREQRAKQ
jgi:electron transfer flavoprotein alpha subunit